MAGLSATVGKHTALRSPLTRQQRRAIAAYMSPSAFPTLDVEEVPHVQYSRDGSPYVEIAPVGLVDRPFKPDPGPWMNGINGDPLSAVPYKARPSPKRERKVKLKRSASPSGRDGLLRRTLQSQARFDASAPDIKAEALDFIVSEWAHFHEKGLPPQAATFIVRVRQAAVALAMWAAAYRLNHIYKFKWEGGEG